MRPAVQAVRRELHAKLGVHDRCDLMQRALQLGFTRAERAGIFPLGLRVLAQEYSAHSQRPLKLPL